MLDLDASLEPDKKPSVIIRYYFKKEAPPNEIITSFNATSAFNKMWLPMPSCYF